MTLAPAKQGGLDALCGLYSVVNALYIASKRIEDNGFRDVVLSAAVKRLGSDGLFNAFCFNDASGGGLLMKQLRPALAAAIESANLTFKTSLYLEVDRSSYETPTDFIAHLERGLARHDTAIIKVSPRNNENWHWTVATKVGADSISLADSAGLSRLAKWLLVLDNHSGDLRGTPRDRHVVAPHQTIFVGSAA